MHTTTRSTTAGAIALVLGMVFTMLTLAAAPASAADLDITSSPAQDGVCADDENNKVDIDQDKDDPSETGQLAGMWGTADGQEDVGTVDVTVKPGWTLEICLKQSTEYQFFTVSCPASSTEPCTGSLQTPGNGNGLSHFSWRNAELTPPDPLVEVDATEWVDGEFECEDTTVEQTRQVTTTTTTYKVEDGKIVVDEVTVEGPVEETQTRELTEEEIFACPGPELPEPLVESVASEWIDGEFECEDDEVVQTREVTTTTTTYTIVDGEVVVGSVSEETETETRARELTAEDYDAADCEAVLGEVLERDPAPAPAAEEVKPAVASEQLPNAGFEEDLLLLLGGAFLALGCSILLYGRRRYGHVS